MPIKWSRAGVGATVVQKNLFIHSFIHSLITRISRRHSERKRWKTYDNKQTKKTKNKKKTLLNVRKKDERKSCILVLLTVRDVLFPGTQIYIQDVPPNTVHPVLHLQMWTLSLWSVPFIRPHCFVSVSGGLRIAVCVPRGAGKKKKLRNNEAMLMQGEMWTESSPCRSADVLHQGRGSIIKL